MWMPFDKRGRERANEQNASDRTVYLLCIFWYVSTFPQLIEWMGGRSKGFRFISNVHKDKVWNKNLNIFHSVIHIVHDAYAVIFVFLLFPVVLVADPLLRINLSVFGKNVIFFFIQFGIVVQQQLLESPINLSPNHIEPKRRYVQKFHHAPQRQQKKMAFIFACSADPCLA